MEQIPPMNGYSKLASLMGAHPELAIFRRFGTPNAQNLLYLQAELVYLENKLQKCVETDAASGHVDRIIYDRDWQTLFESTSTPDGNSEQWNTALRIREVLKEYNETLLLQRLLAKDDNPLPRDMLFLRDWMKRTTMGFVYLLGADGDVYEKPDLPDLIAIKRYQGHHQVTRAIADVLVRFWRRIVVGDTKTPNQDIYANTIRYSDHGLAKAGEVIGTMCASVLPLLAIVVLYFVENMGKRLAAIAVFTSVFSGVLGVFSNGKRIEIFAATASFAAVQVVFIGTTFGGGTASLSG